jgi:hypothetical protein
MLHIYFKYGVHLCFARSILVEYIAMSETELDNMTQ